MVRAVDEMTWREADGPEAAARFPAAGSAFLTPWWWRTMQAAGLADGEEALFLVAGDSDRPRAMLALRRRAGGGLDGLSGPYTCLFAPLLAPGMAADEIQGLGAALAPWLRAAPARFDALAGGAAWLVPFLAGLRAGGLRALRFDHFGNWHEAVGGRDWAAYLADRPGPLRETIRRRTRGDGGTEFATVAGGAGLDGAIAEYEEVYARSWKEPEPFPRFNARLMREAAAGGALRLGLLRREGRAIAAQIWLLQGGTATVVKLAHDEAFKALSPGTVLTARMTRHLIEADGISELDYGRGDDAYKRLWTGARRQRIGVVLVSPFRPAGAAAMLRHGAGALARRWRRR
jgi:hypothetical protein